MKNVRVKPWKVRFLDASGELSRAYVWAPNRLFAKWAAFEQISALVRAEYQSVKISRVKPTD
jgi:hypothetical protein